MMNVDIDDNNTHANMHKDKDNIARKTGTIPKVNRVNNENIDNRGSNKRNVIIHNTSNDINNVKVKMLEMMTKIMSRLDKLEEESRSRNKNQSSQVFF